MPIPADLSLFEISLSTQSDPPTKYRNNYILFVVAATLERAIQIAKEKHPNDPQLSQAIKRNRFGAFLILDDAILTS